MRRLCCCDLCHNSISQSSSLDGWHWLFDPSPLHLMTKAQAVSEFRECIGSMYRGDLIAQHEAWLNFVDTLNEDGLITQWQRDNWTSPIKR